jgi:phenylalanyl-tRNA synthetase beta subunit
MFELSALIMELCPEAVFEDIVDVGTKTQEEKKITFTTDFVNKKIGSNINDSNIENILKNYKYIYSREGENFTVTVPPMRLDLEIPEDMVEEIGRIYGYDKLNPRLPTINFKPKANEVYTSIQKARSYLISQGYREVMTYTFTDKGEVEVLASASDKKFLRTNLLDGLKKSYDLNKLNTILLNINEVKIFEIGTVFKNGNEIVNVAYVNKKESKEMGLNEFISSIGVTSDSEITSDPVIINNFKMWSLYPFIYRDIAVWVPEGTDKEKLSSVYKEFGTELLLDEPILVDTFTKEGRTSYAFRLIFQSYDRTLKDDEINLIMSNIEGKIESLGYESR